MPVSQDVFEQIKDQFGAAPPVAATTAALEKPKAELGWSPIESIGKTAREVSSAAATGFAQGADFLKGIVAGTLMPIIPEGDTPGAKTVAALLRPSMDTLSPATKKAAEEPETVAGKILNPAFKGVGGMATMPIPGAPVVTAAGRAAANMAREAAGYAASEVPAALESSKFLMRNLVAGMGMGEGEAIGKNVLGGLFGYFSPDARKAGEATGSILGGGLGAQANVTRMSAMGEALRQPIDALGKIKPAYESAKAQKAAGDSRKLYEIFADEFGNLRAQTRGLIEQYTNADLAGAIRKDIAATRNATQFEKDAALTGLESEVAMKAPSGEVTMVKPWGLAERTMSPALTKLATNRVPATFAEGLNIEAGAKARQQAIVNAYNKLIGPRPPASEEGAQAAGQLFQRITQAKVNALDQEANAARDAFPDLSQSQLFKIGDAAREIRDARANASYGEAASRYARAENMFNSEGVRIPSGNVLAEAKDLLKEFYVRTDPQETISPIVSNIVGVLRKEPKAGPQLILPADLAAERAAAEGAVQSKDISLADANSLIKALGNAASNAKQAEQFEKFNRMRELQQEVLDSIKASPASPAAKQAFDDARAYWAQEHAPRYMEGLGKALGKERGGVMEGREAIKNEDVMTKFLADKETGMQDFDRIYGNDPKARELLGTTLESTFRNKVMDAKTPEALTTKLTDFKNSYSPVLERFPKVAEKIDAAAAKVESTMNQRDLEISRYKDIMGSPVSQAIGPVQAKIMYQNVLSDPLKMDSLLRAMPKSGGDAAEKMVKEVFLQAHPMKNGTYDPDALLSLLEAGKTNAATKSSMEKLFESAYGKEVGKRQMDTLEAIAGFTKRELATQPLNVRPGSLIGDSPVKSGTGQTAASWISAWRAQEMGVTGSSYFTILGLSRFANARVQAAVEKAKLKALYDPDTATAILEMAATPATQPLGISTARKIFGDIRMPDGSTMLDRLLDRGYVRQYIGRGLAYGAESAAQDNTLPVFGKEPNLQ